MKLKLLLSFIFLSSVNCYGMDEITRLAMNDDGTAEEQELMFACQVCCPAACLLASSCLEPSPIWFVWKGAAVYCGLGCGRWCGAAYVVLKLREEEKKRN